MESLCSLTRLATGTSVSGSTSCKVVSSRTCPELVQNANNCVQATYIYHATSEQHRAVIICVPMEAAKAAKQLITTYLPIVCSLLTLDESVKEHLKKKSPICFVCHGAGEILWHFVNILHCMNWRCRFLVLPIIRQGCSQEQIVRAKMSIQSHP